MRLDPGQQLRVGRAPWWSFPVSDFVERHGRFGTAQPVDQWVRDVLVEQVPAEAHPPRIASLGSLPSAASVDFNSRSRRTAGDGLRAAAWKAASSWSRTDLR